MQIARNHNRRVSTGTVLLHYCLCVLIADGAACCGVVCVLCVFPRVWLLLCYFVWVAVRTTVPRSIQQQFPRNVSKNTQNTNKHRRKKREIQQQQEREEEKN